MAKSIVGTYIGGRGSGKTLSMSVACLYKMLAGKTVWANYPIKWGLKNDDGTITAFRSKHVDIEDLISFKEEIRNGIIALDELNIWANSRSSGAIINRLLNAIFQQLRKRKLSIYITCQSFGTLDKMIRFQTDLICECFDLSFRYPNLKEGSYISQMITDYSGVCTGRAIYKIDDMVAWKRNTRTRIMKGSQFWNIYDSWAEYDVIDAMSSRYHIERQDKVIGDPSNAAGFRRDLAKEKIREFATTVSEIHPDGYSCPAKELQEDIKAWGVNLDSRILGQVLKEEGFEYKHTAKGYIYKFPAQKESTEA